MEMVAGILKDAEKITLKNWSGENISGFWQRLSLCGLDLPVF